MSSKTETSGNYTQSKTWKKIQNTHKKQTKSETRKQKESDRCTKKENTYKSRERELHICITMKTPLEELNNDNNPIM